MSDVNVRIAKILGFGIHDVSYWAKYDEDLNLMHILEKGLTQEEKFRYVCLLTGPPVDEETDTDSYFRLAHATAAQKAEAWLKVKER